MKKREKDRVDASIDNVREREREREREVTDCGLECVSVCIIFTDVSYLPR